MYVAKRMIKLHVQEVENEESKKSRDSAICKNMRYLFSFDLIPYSVIAPSSISGLLHHMPYF